MKSARVPCPDCGRGKRDDTCGVKIDDKGGTYHCFRCGLKGFLKTSEIEEFLGGQVPEEAAPASPKSNERALRCFTDALEITPDDVAGRYLLARGCILPPPRSHLRWAPKVRHKCGYVGPALIALLSDAIANSFSSIHKTWICENGEKADVDPPRSYQFGLPKGICRLFPDDVVHLGLGVAEGIETALTLAKAYTPVWACMDADGLGKLPYLYPIETLVVAVDDDDAGARAFACLQETWGTQAEVCRG